MEFFKGAGPRRRSSARLSRIRPARNESVTTIIKRVDCFFTRPKGRAALALNSIHIESLGDYRQAFPFFSFFLLHALDLHGSV